MSQENLTKSSMKEYLEKIHKHIDTQRIVAVNRCHSDWLYGCVRNRAMLVVSAYTAEKMCDAYVHSNW